MIRCPFRNYRVQKDDAEIYPSSHHDDIEQPFRKWSPAAQETRLLVVIGNKVHRELWRYYYFRAFSAVPMEITCVGFEKGEWDWCLAM